MGPLLLLSLGAGALWGGYKLFFEKPKARFAGDLAQTGDVVSVAPSFLSQATLPQMPPGTISVDVKVLGGDAERVQGPIVAFGDKPTPEFGTFVVQRNTIFRVKRNGRTVADSPGTTTAKS